MSAQEILHTLGVEYRDRSKYYVSCPECGGNRKQQNTRSLLVTIDEEYVRLRCFHSSSCKYYNGEFYKLGGEMKRQHKYSLVNIPETVIPNVQDNATLYTYRNKENEILFYIIRVDFDNGKQFYPVSFTSTGELVYETRPIKTLYKAEKLDPELSSTVIVVEGEKAADAAEKIFTKAHVVCWSGGAKNTKNADMSLIEGYQKVVLWPDNDAVGLQAMLEIANQIKNKNVYIVDVSSLPAGADLADDIDHDIIADLFKKATRLSKDRTVFDFATPETLRQSFHRLKEGGLEFGFSNLDADIRLPAHGIVSIVGRSNHGKSNFMVNLAVNLLKTYEDIKIAYLSLEMTQGELAIRMAQVYEGVEFSEIGWQNQKEYIDRYEAGTIKAQKFLDDALQSDRLLLTDKPADLEKLIKLISLNTQNKHVVIFVDYFQLIDVPQQSARYLEIKRVLEKLREYALQHNVLVIGGSQLTANHINPNADTMREGGDIKNTSALILKIWNKRVVEGTEDPYSSMDSQVVVQIIKTRQGFDGKFYGFNTVGGVKYVPFAVDNPKQQLVDQFKPDADATDWAEVLESK